MWLFGKKNKAEKLDDKIWVTTDKKYASIIADANEYLAKEDIVFIVYHFTGTGEAIAGKLETGGHDFAKIHDPGAYSRKKINLAQARGFQSGSYASKLTIPNIRVIILFAEHYPLYSIEKSITDAIGQTGTGVLYGFYTSFEEPILQRFGAENIKSMLQKLGMDENEALSHSLVTRSIENVQKKIEKKVAAEMKANSMNDWFNKNFQEI